MSSSLLIDPFSLLTHHSKPRCIFFSPSSSSLFEISHHSPQPPPSSIIEREALRKHPVPSQPLSLSLIFWNLEQSKNTRFHWFQTKSKLKSGDMPSPSFHVFFVYLETEYRLQNGKIGGGHAKGFQFWHDIMIYCRSMDDLHNTTKIIIFHKFCNF